VHDVPEARRRNRERERRAAHPARTAMMASGVGSGTAAAETCPTRGVIPPLIPLGAIDCGPKLKELTGKGRVSGPVTWTDATVATTVEDVVPVIAPLSSPWRLRPEDSGLEEPWVWKVTLMSKGRWLYVMPIPSGSG